MKYKIRGNVHLGKCLFGEMSFGELYVGEMSVRGIVRLRNCRSGKCLRGTVLGEKVCWGKVCRANVRGKLSGYRGNQLKCWRPVEDRWASVFLFGSYKDNMYHYPYCPTFLIVSASTMPIEQINTQIYKTGSGLPEGIIYKKDP